MSYSFFICVYYLAVYKFNVFFICQCCAINFHRTVCCFVMLNCLRRCFYCCFGFVCLFVCFLNHFFLFSLFCLFVLCFLFIFFQLFFRGFVCFVIAFTWIKDRPIYHCEFRDFTLVRLETHVFPKCPFLFVCFPLGLLVLLFLFCFVWVSVCFRFWLLKLFNFDKFDNV